MDEHRSVFDDMAELSVRARHALSGAGVDTLEKLQSLDVASLKKIKGCGRQTLQEIVAFSQASGTGILDAEIARLEARLAQLRMARSISPLKRLTCIVCDGIFVAPNRAGECRKRYCSVECQKRSQRAKAFARRHATDEAAFRENLKSGRCAIPSVEEYRQVLSRLDGLRPRTGR